MRPGTKRRIRVKLGYGLIVLEELGIIVRITFFGELIEGSRISNNVTSLQILKFEIRIDLSSNNGHLKKRNFTKTRLISVKENF